MYCVYMIAKVFKSGNSLALRLPRELNPVEGEMHIEPQGERWVVTPGKPREWPENFFETIRIEDKTFCRPEQGAHREFSL